MLSFLTFFLTFLSFCFVCLSYTLWILMKQSGSSESSTEIRLGNYIPAHSFAQRLGPNTTSLFASWPKHNNNTCVWSHPPRSDSPVLSIFSTSLNKSTSLDSCSCPKRTGLQLVLFNFTATAPNHLTFQGAIFCSSY